VHQNFLNIEKIEGGSTHCLIKNHMATIEGDKVVKLIEISMGDKKVQIIDYFSIPSSIPSPILNSEPQSQQAARPASIHRNLMDKRRKYLVNEEGKEEPISRDMKNVVKNIFKLFQSWIEYRSPSEHNFQLK
jgi:hypothetical protein